MIWIRALDMHGKSVLRTGANLSQETRFGSRLIASLKRWKRKKENEVPKYLIGKK